MGINLMKCLPVHETSQWIKGELMDYYTEGCDSVGGVKIYVEFENTSGKTIKCITFYVNAYNSAFEQVDCTISYKGTALMKMNGTLDRYGRSNIGNGPYGDSISPTRNHFGITTDSVWYNSSIKYLEVTKIDIKFCDGIS